jgi:hypothetical protein
MDKGNGQLLQSYSGHVNKDYRIRSTMGLNDSVVVSGSEDGALFVWDLLDGKILHRIEGVHAGKVPSAVAFNGTRKEWASAGGDGKSTRSVPFAYILLRVSDQLLPFRSVELSLWVAWIDVLAQPLHAWPWFASWNEGTSGMHSAAGMELFHWSTLSSWLQVCMHDAWLHA